MLKKKYNSDEIQNDQIKKLYNIAKSVAIPQKINEQICFGGVGAVVLTKQGNIYTGVLSIQIVHLVCVPKEMHYLQ